MSLRETYCRTLQLHIRGFGGLDDLLLCELLERWHALESLDLRNNTRVSLDGTQVLPHSLRRLSIQGCSRVS